MPVQSCSLYLYGNIKGESDKRIGYSVFPSRWGKLGSGGDLVLFEFFVTKQILLGYLLPMLPPLTGEVLCSGTVLRCWELLRGIVLLSRIRITGVFISVSWWFCRRFQEIIFLWQRLTGSLPLITSGWGDIVWLKEPWMPDLWGALPESHECCMCTFLTCLQTPGVSDVHLDCVSFIIYIRVREIICKKFG